MTREMRGQKNIINTHHWGLRRGDAKTLREDAGVVGGPGAVPQQLPIVQLLKGLEALAFSLAVDFEDLNHSRFTRVKCQDLVL